MPNQSTKSFDLQGSFHPAGAFREKEDDPIKLSPPSGLAFTPEGDLVLADDFNHRIQIYGTDRKIKLTFGEKGDLYGQMNYPRGVDVDKHGFIYVTDSWNHRVQKFDPSGQHILTFGGYGDGPGQMNEPYDVLVETSGRIIVVERYNHRIQFFDSEGNSQGWLGSRAIVLEDRLAWIYGTPPALFPRPVFELPTSITRDTQGNYFIADSGNHRIVKFNLDWKFLHSFGIQGSEPGKFQYPLGVEAGCNDLIYVADLNNNRVQVFDSLGQFLFILTEGSKLLETPCLTCMGPDGRLYVGMTFHTRIEVFETPQVSRQEFRNQGAKLHSENFKTRFCQGQSLEEEEGNAIEAYAKAVSLMTQAPEPYFPWDAPLSGDAFIAPIRWAQTILDQSINAETEALFLKCLAFYDAGMEELARELTLNQEKWIGYTEDVSNKLVAEENLVLQQKEDPLKFNRELYIAETKERKLYNHMRALFWVYRNRAAHRAEFTDLMLNCSLSENVITRFADALRKRYLTVCRLIQIGLDEKEKREAVMVTEFGGGLDNEKKWSAFRSKFMSNQKTLDVLKQLQHEFRMVLKQITRFGKIRPEGESLFNDLFLEFPQALSLHKILVGYQEDRLGYHDLEQDVFDLFDTWIYQWGEKTEPSLQAVTLNELDPVPYDREETVAEENLQTLIAEGTSIKIKNGKLRLGHKLFSTTWPKDQTGDLIQKVSTVLETMKAYEENFKEIFNNLEALTRQRSELDDRLKTIDPRDKRAPIALRNNSHVLDFQIGLLYRMVRTLGVNELNNAFRLVLGGAILSAQFSARENANHLFEAIRRFQTDLSHLTQSNLKKKKILFFEKAALDNQLRTDFSKANVKAFEERVRIQNRLVEMQLEVDRLRVILNKQLRIQNLVQKLLNFVDSDAGKTTSTPPIRWKLKGMIHGPSYDQGGFLGLCNVAISSDGILHIVDHIKHTVYRMTPQGRILGTFGGYGNGPGAMQWPKNIQIGRYGNIYISEGTNRCVHVFSAEGRFLFKFGNTGERPLLMPNDISLDEEENIWVTDTKNNCVQIYSPEGQFVKTWLAKAVGVLKEPAGICCLENNRVAIADRSEYLVKLFNCDGSFIKGVKKNGLMENDLFTLTYDSRFGILCPDSWTPQIIQLGPDLEVVSTFSLPGKRLGQFGVIPGLATHDGLLYVTDYENPKVTVFESME